MRAVGYKRSLSIDDPNSLLDVELAKPDAAGHDLLVAIKAVSVNPVDCLVRTVEDPRDQHVRVLGWDAAGTVVATGEACELFRPGDEVYYAGSRVRPGCNSEFHLVDERIVGRKPANLSFAEAAALPLTTITAWEVLFDRLGVPRSGHASGGAAPTLLLIGGGGGVGSITIQLARHLTPLRVVATASRPESMQWCRTLGAHDVIDHAKPMAEVLERIGCPIVDYVFSTTNTEEHFDLISEIIAPHGKVCFIDNPKSIDVLKLKRKSAALLPESMFTRPIFQTADMIAQHKLLEEVRRLVEQGIVQTTLAQNLGTIDAANLRRAHAMLEAGHTRGKLVLEGFA